MFPVGTGMNRVAVCFSPGADSVPRGYGDEPHWRCSCFRL